MNALMFQHSSKCLCAFNLLMRLNVISQKSENSLWALIVKLQKTKADTIYKEIMEFIRDCNLDVANLGDRDMMVRQSWLVMLLVLPPKY